MSSIFELAKGVQLTRTDLLHRAADFVEARRSNNSNSNDDQVRQQQFPTVVVGALVKVFDGDLEEGENADQNSSGAAGSSSSSYRVGSIISVLEISSAAKDEDLETECCFAIEFGYKRESVVELRYVSNQAMDSIEHDLFTAECAKMHFASNTTSGAAPLGSSRLLLSTEELLNLRKLLGRNTGKESYVSKRNIISTTNGASKPQQQQGAVAAGRDELLRRLLDEKKDLQKQLREKDELIRQFALKSHSSNEEAMASSQAEIQQLKAKNEQLVREQEDAKKDHEGKMKEIKKLFTTANNRDTLTKGKVMDYFQRKGVAPKGKTAKNLTPEEIGSILEKL